MLSSSGNADITAWIPAPLNAELTKEDVSLALSIVIIIVIINS